MTQATIGASAQNFESFRLMILQAGIDSQTMMQLATRMRPCPCPQCNQYTVRQDLSAHFANDELS